MSRSQWFCGIAQHRKYKTFKDLEITRQEVLDALAEMVQKLFSDMDYDEQTYSSIKNSKNGNYVFHYGTPVLIIVSNIKSYGNALADSSCALENMMLMANEHDLSSYRRWITNKNCSKTKRKLSGLGGIASRKGKMKNQILICLC